MAVDKICEDYLKDQWDALIPSDHQYSNRYFNQLISAYSEAKRFYHTPQHLCHLIDLLHEAAINDTAVYWASFYHDYVYVVGRKDNEIKSAEIAKTQMQELDVDSKTIYRCCELILLTQSHQLTSNDSIAAAFLDADMSILGVEPKDYADYVAKVEKEYSSIPSLLYKIGRKQFLEACQKQQRLFNTDWFFDRFEAQARKNLAWELSVI